VEVPELAVHGLVVGEDGGVVLAFEHLAAAVQARGALVEQHLQVQATVGKEKHQ